MPASRKVPLTSQTLNERQLFRKHSEITFREILLVSRPIRSSSRGPERAQDSAAAAGKELKDEIHSEEKSGQKPQATELKLLPCPDDRIKNGSTEELWPATQVQVMSRELQRRGASPTQSRSAIQRNIFAVADR